MTSYAFSFTTPNNFKMCILVMVTRPQDAPDPCSWYSHIYVAPYYVILGLVCVTDSMWHKWQHVHFWDSAIKDTEASIWFAHFLSDHLLWGKPAAISSSALQKGSHSEEPRPVASSHMSLENRPSSPSWSLQVTSAAANSLTATSWEILREAIS